MLEDILYTCQRVGKDGKPITIRKLKTMRDSTEEEVKELIRTHGLDENGKIRNDPRVTKLGKLLRHYWVDEWLQLINVLKGEMSLVGVRPKPYSHWEPFPKDHVEHVLRYKPGWFPAAAANIDKKDFPELVREEREYLRKKDIAPLKTDMQYFLKGLYNIVFRGFRGT